MSERFHEAYPLVAVIAAGTVTSTPKTSSWADVSSAHELIAELVLGDMAAETIDFRIEQATSSTGAGAKTLQAATQLTASATVNDNKVVQVSVDAAKLDSTNGFRYARLVAVTGGATGGLAVATLRIRSRELAGTQDAAVLETKVA